MKEQYQPSSEEIQAAEDSMTPRQAELSKERDLETGLSHMVKLEDSLEKLGGAGSKYKNLMTPREIELVRKRELETGGASVRKPSEIFERAAEMAKERSGEEKMAQEIIDPEQKKLSEERNFAEGLRHLINLDNALGKQGQGLANLLSSKELDLLKTGGLETSSDSEVRKPSAILEIVREAQKAKNKIEKATETQEKTRGGFWNLFRSKKSSK